MFDLSQISKWSWQAVCAKVQAANVKVGKVGRVGLVQVVVGFPERGAAADDEGLEEGGGTGRDGALSAEGYVREEAVKEADLAQNALERRTELGRGQNREDD